MTFTVLTTTFRMEMHRGRNWYNHQRLAKSVIVTVFLFLIGLLLLAGYGIAKNYFFFLSLQEQFGNLIARYLLSAAFLITGLIAVVTGVGLNTKVWFNTPYLNQLFTLPVTGRQIFFSRLALSFISGSWPLLFLIPIILAYLTHFGNPVIGLNLTFWALFIFALGVQGLSGLLTFTLVPFFRRHGYLLSVFLVLGAFLTFKLIFSWEFQNLYHAPDLISFEQLFYSLPLNSFLLPTNWLAGILTEPQSTLYFISALILAVDLLGITCLLGWLYYTHLWQQYSQYQPTIFRKFSLFRQSPHFPLAWSPAGSLLANHLLKIWRTPVEFNYLGLIAGLTVLLLVFSVYIPHLKFSAPQFLPLSTTFAFTGGIHLWLLSSARFLYSARTSEYHTSWIWASKPILKFDWLNSYLLLATCFSLPALFIGLIVGHYTLPSLTGKLIFACLMLINAWGVSLVQLLWGIVIPNFSEADNPGAASTSISGLIALITSLTYMITSGWFIYAWQTNLTYTPLLLLINLFLLVIVSAWLYKKARLTFYQLT